MKRQVVVYDGRLLPGQRLSVTIDEASAVHQKWPEICIQTYLSFSWQRSENELISPLMVGFYYDPNDLM